MANISTQNWDKIKTLLLEKFPERKTLEPEDVVILSFKFSPGNASSFHFALMGIHIPYLLFDSLENGSAMVILRSGDSAVNDVLIVANALGGQVL